MREERFTLKVKTVETRAARIVEGAGHKLRPDEAAISAALEWLKRAGVRQVSEARTGR